MSAPDLHEATPRPEVPERARLPLLERITSQSMDEDYEHVARRKAAALAAGAQAPPEGRGPGRVVTGVAVAIFGILIAVAAVQTSRNADVEALGRASLIERIGEEKADVRALQDRAGELRDANAKADESLRELRAQEQDINARVRRLGVSTGYLAVRGPGLRVTVDDAPNGDETQAVLDEDLVILVDGLWAAGAEAIAINGQRLTALSSIQNTGRAIHVNVRPLAPPYEILAIGDPDRLEADLLSTTHGAVWFSLARTLGFVFKMEDDDNLELPAARIRPLRSAVVGTTADNQGKDKEINP